MVHKSYSSGFGSFPNKINNKNQNGGRIIDYKYTYTYEEYSQDTRSYTVESNVKLTEQEIQDMALSCEMVEGSTYSDKDSKATFKGNEYGDDTQTEYGGDEIKEDEEDK